MTNPLGPLPQPTPDDQGFWDACNDGRLVIQKCSGCGALRHLPRPMCPKCRSMRYEWAPMSGRGVVHSFTVVHHPVHPALRDQVPYGVVLVELEEGPRIVSNMLDMPVEDIAIGLPVVVTFQEVAPGVKLPKFIQADTT